MSDTKIKIKHYTQDSIYIVHKKSDGYKIKKITELENKKIIESIIINSKKEVKVIKKVNSKSIVLTYNEILDIINELFIFISKSSMIKDIINIDELRGFIESSIPKNILISNGVLGISNDKDHFDDKIFLDVIDIKSNHIIGHISIDDKNIKMFVDEIYEKQVLFLLRRLIYDFRKDSIDKYKVLRINR